jgi:YQGE family putative transporter
MNEKIKHRTFTNWARSFERRVRNGSQHEDPIDPLEEGTSLGKQGILLLIINSLYAVAGALSTTFVNIFLWKVKNDYAMIGWFNLSHFVAMGLTFLIMGRVVKQTNKMISLRLGVAISAVFYLVVLLLGKSSVDYVIWLGIIQGMGTGFYWLAFNVVYFEISNPLNRDRFNGLSGFWGSLAWMIAPWIAGWLISTMNDTVGYRVIFTVSLITFSIAVVLSFFLKHRKVQGRYELFSIIKKMRGENKIWRSISLAMVAQGTREGVFAFLIGLFVYIITQNEMKLGTYNLITAGIALIAYFLIGKYLRPEWRKTSMMVGTIMLSLFILPLFWKLNYTTLIIFGIGTNLFLPFYLVPLTSIVFDAIGKDQDSAEHRVEYVVVREIGLNIGRILSVSLFLVVVAIDDSYRALTFLMFFVGSIPILAWLAVRKAKLKSLISKND